ncbi:IclR family transcriptional regulator [Streptomyces erythrochromogenes]|uniref:hypothetical protein n=1 Tax=Streptomyces erythrochromogenes TaxID=285574 RepID=UPI00369015BD
MRNDVVWQPRHGYYALTAYQERGEFFPQQWVPASMAGRHVLGVLSEQTGQTVGLHAAVLTDVPVQVCVSCLDGPSGLSQRPQLGVPRPLGEDAAGSAILAHLRLPHPKPEERHAVRFRGWATSPGPVPESQMIAVPLLRFGLPVGALSITARTEQDGSRIPSCVPALKRAALSLADLSARSLVSAAD